MILNGSNTKKGYLFQIGGESVAIIWSTAARLFLLSCHQPLLRSSGLPCPDFQMNPPQLSTRKRMTKSASLPLIFHLHTWIKQQGPNGLKARMVGRDLHICCVFTYLEISWAKRRGKGDWDQQPDREKPCRTSYDRDLGSPQSFTENYSRWCIYPQMLTNTEQLNGLRLENHPKESKIMLGFETFCS